jgi:putative membrane protein
MKLFWHWIVSALAIGVAAYLIPNVMITIPGALILAIVLGALNLLLKPLLIILTLPINILTLGLFTFVINAALVMLAALVVPGFDVAGFWSALLFAVVLMIVNWVFHLWAE